MKLRVWAALLVTLSALFVWAMARNSRCGEPPEPEPQNVVLTPYDWDLLSRGYSGGDWAAVT